MVRHLLVAAAALAITAGASANEFTNMRPLVGPLAFNFLEEGQFLTETVTLGPGKPVVGFKFEGTWLDDGLGAETFWASDLAMTITAPSGRAWTVGGWNNFATRNENWNGWIGSNGGVPPPGQPMGVPPNDGNIGPGGIAFAVNLSSMHFPWKESPEPKEGLWTVRFMADFPGVPARGFPPGLNWAAVNVSLLNIPAPSALALLGLGGFLAKRRRR